jgi:ABC-type transport system involved in multi-copper enzyme maturation permease subunit
MTRLRTLTGMALREMWISFRLIAVIGVPMIGGIVVVALPPDLAGETAIGGAGFWYAIVAAAAICVASAIAAGSVADERRRGTVAWMAVRAVPRSAVLLSWFLAFGILLAVGIAVGSVGAWLAAAARAEAPPNVIPFAAAIGSAAGVALAGVAGGLLIGTLLRTIPAVVVTVALVGGLLAAGIVLPLPGAQLPSGGIGLLAHLDDAARPVSDALQSTGLALSVAAGLLVLAAAALERSDL